MTNIQENLEKAFDVNAIQENLKTMFDADAIQAQLKDLYSAEKFQENVNKTFSNEAFTGAKEYVESLVDQEQVQQSVKFGANVIAANTSAVSDALTLSAVQFGDGVEAALKQVDVLVATKDTKEAAEAQQAYAKSLQNTLTESAWMSVGLVAGALETNVNLTKEALEQVKAAQKTA